MLIFQLLLSSNDAVGSFVGSNYINEENTSVCKRSYKETRKST